MTDQKTEQKHTPGPWQVGPVFDNDGTPEIIIEHMTPHGNLVVAVALSGLIGQKANARLIAAAPDLLSALKALAPHLGAIVSYASTMGEHEPNRLAVNALAAIAKATGGPRHD